MKLFQVLFKNFHGYTGTIRFPVSYYNFHPLYLMGRYGEINFSEYVF